MEKLVKYGEEYIGYISLKTAGSTAYQANPTLAAGDVKVTQDGVDFGNIDSLSTVTPAGGTQVKVTVSIAEMTGKQIQIQFIDVAGAEWEPATLFLATYGDTSAQHPYMGEGVWDRELKGSTHNIPTSAGRRLRQIAGIIFDDGTAQAGDVNSITLSSGASSTDGLYWQTYVFIVAGTGAGQGHHIVAYDGTTKIATIDDDWVTQPDATSEYTLFGSGSHEAIEEGIPTAVANNTITLNTYSPAVDGQYNNFNISIISGTGNHQTRRIIDYNGTTKVATVERDWDVNPTTASGYWIDRAGLNVNDIWDEVLISSNHNVSKSAGKRLRELLESILYEGGFIYYDSTGGGSAGNEPFVNGTLENPVDNETDLNTLIASLSIKDIKIIAGSALTLSSSAEKRVYTGEIWTLALGSQSVSGSTFHGADVSGICTGAIKPKFEDCNINVVTVPPCHMDKCGIAGPITAGSVGDFFVADNCHSAVAGTGAPVLDFGAAVGDVNFNLRWYSGGIDLRNMGQVGTDRISVEGNGQVIINANCIGGTIAIRGHQTITGEEDFVAAGGVISDDARFATDQLTVVSVIAAIEGAVQTSYASTGGIVEVVKGDTVSIPYDLTVDMTSKTLFFAAKKQAGHSVYKIVVTEITSSISDAAEGQGVIPLTTAMLSIPAMDYDAEMEMRDADGTSNPITILKFKLNVVEQVIV